MSRIIEIDMMMADRGLTTEQQDLIYDSVLDIIKDFVEDEIQLIEGERE